MKKLGSAFLDLCERLASDRSGIVGRNIRHSYALLCDRCQSLILYGALIVLYNHEISAAFLGLAILDFMTCWLDTPTSTPTLH